MFNEADAHARTQGRERLMASKHGESAAAAAALFVVAKGSCPCGAAG